MAYLSLYRKHRPSTFDEVVGQEHVIRTLRNAITEDRLHHAYLFTGQRGTGKTSTARILAAAVNCVEGPTADPCGECEQCVSIVAGRNVDVIELDMASHGGVDDARELRDRAVFAPASARKKVYILDEVHMASTAAFNALLKVVEEPPSHVLFAMATTDPQKVLPTIMSRVQRLDLRRVPAPEVTAHLRRLGELEGFTLDDEAAAGVVAAGDGSVRDTLSVLEQVLAFASDADARDDQGVLAVTGQHVTKVLGATPFELTAEIVDAVADADVSAALTGIQGLLDGGHDLRRFTLDLARHLRDLLVMAAAPGADGLVDATVARQERLATQAQRFGTDSLVRAVQLVGDVLVEQRQGPPRLPLELAVARLATPGADGDVQALADRVARLEKAVDGGVEVGGAPRGIPAPAARPTPTQDAGEAADEGAATDGSASAEAAPPADGDDTVEDVGSDERDGGPAPEADRGSASAEAVETTGTGRAAATDATDATEVSTGEDEADDADEPDDETDAADGADGEAGGAAATDATDAVDTEVDADDTEVDTDDAEAEGGEDAAGLAERAAAMADRSGPLTDPDPLEDRPGTTRVERELPDSAPSGTDELARISAAWESILELIADESRRAKAFYEPATPVRLNNGVLLLAYPASRRFHAEQGRSGEMTAFLADAIKRSTGLERIRIDVRVEDGESKRPTPPPAAGGSDDGPSDAEVAAVTEVEQAADDQGEVDPEQVDELLRSELGAERMEDDEL